MQGGTNLYKSLTKAAVWRCEAGGDGGDEGDEGDEVAKDK